MQQPGSITFGTPLAPVSSAPAFGGFGSQSTTTGLKFGTTPSLFGQPSTPAGGLTFGAVSQPPAATAPATTSTGFLFGGQSAAPTSTPQLSLFGAQPITSTAANTGFSFGTTPATTATGLGTTPASTLNFGLGNSGAQPTTTTNSLFSSTTGGLFGAKPLTTTSTTNQPTISIGLGGVDTFENKPGSSSGVTTKENDGKLAKENVLPQEFLQLIDGFKNHIKQQKLCFSEVARGSAKPILKVREDIESFKTQLTEISNGQINNRQMAERLKFDSAKCLSHAEMAQRIHDTPAGFQVDNSAPLQYFIETVNHFENHLNAIRQQIEATEKHIKSMETPKTLSSQEMTLGLKHLHETFVALAGRLQSLHNQVEMQKDQYINMRKYLFKDSVDIFDKIPNNNNNKNTDDTFKKLLNSSLPFIPPKRAAGPTPFSSLGTHAPLSFLSQQSNNNPTTVPPPAYPGQTTLSWGNATQTPGLIKTTQPPSYNASVGNLTTTSSLFNSNISPSSSDFQLQKPPTGNKRGKH